MLRAMGLVGLGCYICSSIPSDDFGTYNMFCSKLLKIDDSYGLLIVLIGNVSDQVSKYN